jgi:hypothetical protein
MRTFPAGAGDVAAVGPGLAVALEDAVAAPDAGVFAGVVAGALGRTLAIQFIVVSPV